MDKMSLFAILTVSLPEAILDIYFGLLASNRKQDLYLYDPRNIFRLIGAAIVMSSTSAAVRWQCPNLTGIFIFNAFYYVLILMVVYNLHWIKAVRAVLSFYALLITIELAYPMQFMAALGIKPDDLYANDTARLLLSAPERFIQLFAVISIWNMKKISIIWQEFRLIRLPLALLAAALLTCEVGFLYHTWSAFNTLSAVERILCPVLCFAFSIVNLLLVKLISVFTHAVLIRDFVGLRVLIKFITADYKLIHDALERGDIETAKSRCRVRTNGEGSETA